MTSLAGLMQITNDDGRKQLTLGGVTGLTWQQRHWRSTQHGAPLMLPLDAGDGLL